MTERSARALVQELFDRLESGDKGAVDELIHPQLINHAASPQGAAGWRAILAAIDHDLGPVRVERRHLFGENDLAALHTILHGRHRASTMPLLVGIEPTNQPVSWSYIHIWRAEAGRLVEHWAERSDRRLIEQCAGTADVAPVEDQGD